MAGFAGLFGARGAPEKKTTETDVETTRADQRRQRMADAEVSLDELKADVAALTGHSSDPGRPVHPGEVLWEAYMKPMGVKAPTTAKALGVPRTRIERLIAGQTAMSPDTALRLSRAFTTTTALFWLNLQAAYDLEIAEQDVGSSLSGIRPFKYHFGGVAA